MHYLCTLFGKKMKIEKIFLLFGLSFLHLTTFAQDDYPKVSPTATYLDSKNELQTVTSISDGEAPLEVTFHANPQNMGSHTPAYEWHFRKQGEEGDLFVRYEEETTYRFVDSGTFDVTLLTTLTDTGESLDSVTITVAIAESTLKFPNAFSPNGDEWNEVFKAKEYKSLVEFHAYIFNRWGQKLFEWTDPAEGWDGKYNGNDVKDGVYFLLVKAKGADGHVYHIRQDVNLLRSFVEETVTH
jgi:gliding motility-associated-like protein